MEDGVIIKVTGGARGSRSLNSHAADAMPSSASPPHSSAPRACPLPRPLPRKHNIEIGPGEDDPCCRESCEGA